MKNFLIIPRLYSRKVVDLISILDTSNIDKIYCVGSKDTKLIKSVYEVTSFDFLHKENGNFLYLPIDEEDFITFSTISKKYKKPSLKLIGPENYKSFLSKSAFYSFAQKQVSLAPCFNETDPINTVYVSKPDMGSGSRDIKVIDFFAAKHFQAKGYFVQKYINSSSDPFGYSGFVNFDGEIYAYSHRRVLTQKGFGGVSLIAEKVITPAQIQFDCNKFLVNNNYYGFFMFEYIVDKDGKNHIIEFNPRIWGSFKLGIKKIKIDQSGKLSVSIDDEKRIYFFINGLCKNYLQFMKILFQTVFTHKFIISPSLKYFYLWKGVYDRKKRN